MAYVSSNRQSALNALPLISRFEEIAEKFRTAYETRRIFRRTLNELHQLSGRELADLGLNPSNLRQVAWETANELVEDRKPV